MRYKWVSKPIGKNNNTVSLLNLSRYLNQAAIGAVCFENGLMNHPHWGHQKSRMSEKHNA